MIFAGQVVITLYEGVYYYARVCDADSQRVFKLLIVKNHDCQYLLRVRREEIYSVINCSMISEGGFIVRYANLPDKKYPLNFN